MEIKHPGSCDSYWQLSTGPHGEPPLRLRSAHSLQSVGQRALSWARPRGALPHPRVFIPSVTSASHSRHPLSTTWRTSEKECSRNNGLLVQKQKANQGLCKLGIWFHLISKYFSKSVYPHGRRSPATIPTPLLFSPHSYTARAAKVLMFCVLSQCATMLVHTSKENIRFLDDYSLVWHRKTLQWRMVKAWCQKGKHVKGGYNHTVRSSQILCTRVLR